MQKHDIHTTVVGHGATIFMYFIDAECQAVILRARVATLADGLAARLLMPLIADG